jgi:hypothetical protein
MAGNQALVFAAEDGLHLTVEVGKKVHGYQACKYRKSVEPEFPHQKVKIRLCLSHWLSFSKGGVPES